MANVQVGWIGQHAADVLSSERYPRLDVAPTELAAFWRAAGYKYVAPTELVAFLGWVIKMSPLTELLPLRRGIRPQVLLKSAAPAAPSHRTAIDSAGPR
jgi:hypothetical protein